MNTVNFLQMKDGSKEDYLLLQDLEHHYIRELPDRLLLALERLDDSLQGYQVSRLEHSLQTASRDHRGRAGPRPRRRTVA